MTGSCSTMIPVQRRAMNLLSGYEIKNNGLLRTAKSVTAQSLYFGGKLLSISVCNRQEDRQSYYHIQPRELTAAIIVRTLVAAVQCRLNPNVQPIDGDKGHIHVK